jgi:hypothetical protein
MGKVLIFMMAVICAVITVSAQTELDLKQYFEGRHVTLKMDMPATKEGVNVYPERAQPLDYSEYAGRLKKYGTSIRRGEEIMITKIKLKLKDKHIEFQLGGGGYGTAGDETDSSVYVSSARKSSREKNLEEEVKRENDSARRKRLKEEIDDLRRRREREDERNREIAAEAQESRRARIEQKALQGGSRFNVHFSSLDANVLTPQALIDALRKYVEFSDVESSLPYFRQVSYRYVAGSLRKPRVVRVGPPTTYLKEGLRTEEVLRVLGEPSTVSERVEQGLVVTTYEFPRGEGRILIAEFISDALVRTRIETRSQADDRATGRSDYSRNDPLATSLLPF